MKIIKVLGFGILLSSVSVLGQGYSTFEDGTFEDWTNSDTTMSDITIEPSGLPFNDDQDLSKTEFYPNPVENNVTVKLPVQDAGIVEFYNVLGEKVLQKVLTGKSTELNLSNLKAGVYLAKVITDKSSVTKKVIKL